MSNVFTGRVVSSLVLYSIIASVTLLWVVTVVMIPLLTTAITFDLTGLVGTFFDFLITVLILFAVVHNGLDLITYAGNGIKPLPSTPKIHRFSLNQRLQHLVLFISMIFLSVTGMAMLFINNWGMNVINFFGGFQNTLNIHYASAIVMGGLVAYHFGFYAAKFVANKATGQPAPLDIMNLGLQDMKDVLTNLKFYLGIGPKPKFGKYNYMEKFDYWGIYWGMIILGLPGVLMWADGVNAFNGLAFVFHTKEALLAVLFLGIFHLYQAHFSPRKLPMNMTFLSGTMSEAEMEEDHPRELEKLKAQGKA
jgi:cytochrome b subunit of formate dehydrogenase